MRRKETSIQRTRHRRKRQDMPKQGTVCGLLAAAGPGVPGTLLTNHADGEPSVLGHDPGLEGQITAIGTLRLGVCEQQVHEALPRQGEVNVYPWKVVARDRRLGPAFVRVELDIVLVPPEPMGLAASVIGAVQPQGVPVENQVRSTYSQPCGGRPLSPACLCET